MSGVEVHSSELKRELGLRDLVLQQIVYVVGVIWVGTAAKLGHQHFVFWIAAIVLFYLPQAAVVIELTRRMPFEGGLYQWATVGLGDFWGFITAWNLWAYTILIMAGFGVMIATNISYLLTPLGATFVTAGWYTPVVSTLVVLALTGISLFGLRVSKWLQALGGAAQFLTYLALIAALLLVIDRSTIANAHALEIAMPSVTLLSLNIFGKMAVGALSGFEYVAILAGECQDPARTIGRSVLFAVPVIALMFILGTTSVLAIVPQDQIDLVSPIPQALTMGFAGQGLARLIAPTLILFLLLRQIGNVALIFAGNTRLPMVAGWDRLVPTWFTLLHPRFRTPHNSIVFVGASVVPVYAAWLTSEIFNFTLVFVAYFLWAYKKVAPSDDRSWLTRPGTTLAALLMVLIVAFAVVALQGPLVAGRRAKLLEHALKANGPGPLGAEARRLTRDPALWIVSFANPAIVLGIVWNMTQKPGTAGAVAAVLVAYAVGAALALLLGKAPASEAGAVTEPSG